MSKHLNLRSVARGVALLSRDPRGFAAKVRGLFQRPKIVVYTEVAAHCNSRCQACAVDKVKRKGFIDERVKGKVAALIGASPSDRFLVYFHLVGEPLLYSGLEGYIQQLSLPNAELWVCTNGALLTDQRLQSLRAAGLKNVWFSMFYAEEEAYRRYTNTKSYEACWEHLDNLVTRRDWFEKIHIVTFSTEAAALRDLLRGTKNVTLEISRRVEHWEYAAGIEPHYLCISIDGEVSFFWQDYNFEQSIGNIVSLPPEEILTAFKKLV